MAAGCGPVIERLLGCCCIAIVGCPSMLLLLLAVAVVVACCCCRRCMRFSVVVAGYPSHSNELYELLEVVPPAPNRLIVFPQASSLCVIVSRCVSLSLALSFYCVWCVCVCVRTAHDGLWLDPSPYNLKKIICLCVSLSLSLGHTYTSSSSRRCSCAAAVLSTTDCYVECCRLVCWCGGAEGANDLCVLTIVVRVVDCCAGCC